MPASCVFREGMVAYVQPFNQKHLLFRQLLDIFLSNPFFPYFHQLNEAKDYYSCNLHKKVLSQFYALKNFFDSRMMKIWMGNNVWQKVFCIPRSNTIHPAGANTYLKWIAVTSPGESPLHLFPITFHWILKFESTYSKWWRLWWQRHTNPFYTL